MRTKHRDRKDKWFLKRYGLTEHAKQKASFREMSKAQEVWGDLQDMSKSMFWEKWEMFQNAVCLVLLSTFGINCLQFASSCKLRVMNTISGGIF